MRVLGVLVEFRTGTATLDQIKAWPEKNNSHVFGQPEWQIEEQDLDLDGIRDSLIADKRLSGSGGNEYSVFLRRPNGFRYVGDVFGRIRTLPQQPGQPFQFVIAHNEGSGNGLAELAELRPDGNTYVLAHRETNDEWTLESARSRTPKPPRDRPRDAFRQQWPNDEEERVRLCILGGGL